MSAPIYKIIRLFNSEISYFFYQTCIQTDVTQPGIFRFIIAPKSGTICFCSGL